MAFKGASVTSLLGFLAGSWAVVMGVSPLLQVRRMRQRQSSADVSIGYLFILFPGFALWIAYGLSSGDLALVIPNIVSLVICAVTIGYALKLRPRTTHTGDEVPRSRLRLSRPRENLGSVGGNGNGVLTVGRPSARRTAQGPAVGVGDEVGGVGHDPRLEGEQQARSKFVAAAGPSGV
jgi:MtN3 and saliva related transmembrane protein